MSKQALFTNVDGASLYWADLSHYMDAQTLIFTYAKNLTLAQSHFSTVHAQEGHVFNVTLMSEADLDNKRLVNACAYWATTSSNSAVLQKVMEAYNTHTQTAEFELLMNVVKCGSFECFEILRPHFSFNYMNGDALGELAQMIGTGGAVEIFSKISHHFSSEHIEKALINASAAQHDRLVDVLAQRCSAQKVLERMQTSRAPEQYQALENWLNTTQRNTIVQSLDIKPSLDSQRRKL